jgi:fumiquinazoline A oxidase
MLCNGIDIDLGNFNTVDVDVKSDTITIGGSVIFDDIFDPLYNAKKEIRKS